MDISAVDERDISIEVPHAVYRVHDWLEVDANGVGSRVKVYELAGVRGLDELLLWARSDREPYPVRSEIYCRYENALGQNGIVLLDVIERARHD